MTVLVFLCVHRVSVVSIPVLNRIEAAEAAAGINRRDGAVVAWTGIFMASCWVSVMLSLAWKRPAGARMAPSKGTRLSSLAWVALLGAVWAA